MITTRPAVGPARGWDFPQPRELWLNNGLRVWLFDLAGQHLISAQIILDAPLSCEPAGLEGVATIAVRGSDEGSLNYPGHRLAEAIEDIGATYGGSARLSATVCQLEVPGTRLAPALRLLGEIVQHPSYDPTDVARHVALRVAEIEQTMAHSTALAQLGFQRAIFDPNSRAGRPSAGQLATVKQIGRDDVASFHDRWWRPSGATLVLAGDLPPQVAAWAEEAFGQWTPVGAAPAVENIRPNPTAPVIWLIDRPDAVQTDLMIGSFAPGREDPRWAGLEVGACAMGGSFGSRLNQVLREERGYTYGAHAAFRALRQHGSFVMQASCRTEVAAEATATALDLLDVSGAEFTAAEIADARTYLLGIAPLHFQTADAIADQASVLASVGLPASWPIHNQTQLTAVTAETASAAFSEVVRPESLSIVMCGDAAQLSDDLAARGLAAQVIEIEA